LPISYAISNQKSFYNDVFKPCSVELKMFSCDLQKHQFALHRHLPQPKRILRIRKQRRFIQRNRDCGASCFPLFDFERKGLTSFTFLVKAKPTRFARLDHGVVFKLDHHKLVHLSQSTLLHWVERMPIHFWKPKISLQVTIFRPPRRANSWLESNDAEQTPNKRQNLATNMNDNNNQPTCVHTVNQTPSLQQRA
jgi:hypothetical protein